MIPLPWRRAPHTTPQQVSSVEDSLRADEYLTDTERRAFISHYRIITDPRREAALNWRKGRAAAVALPFNVPLPSFVLWAVMVATASLMAVLVALFGKAGVEWTGDNDVIPRCRRLWAAAAAKTKSVRRRRSAEAVPDDGS